MDYVCDSLDGNGCERWKECCNEAENCCQRQLSTPTSKYSGNLCPRTWDGWKCFNDTLPGEMVKSSCPSYIKYGDLEGHVRKYCTENGTWNVHTFTGKEWTDYGYCVNKEVFNGVVYATMSASTFSVLLLIPAVIIFCFHRQLRTQQRIQLHVCLFISFIITSSVNIFWSFFVHNDRLQHPLHETFMVRRQTLCKLIYILRRYATCTNFFWLFCEGLFLHRLLVHAFQTANHIRPYLAIGWGGPIIPVLVYAILRIKDANVTCWIANASWFEWVLYGPNLLCILMNMIFLLCILRILLTQLHQHPNEPSNYRRALKAMFVLVPLFGLQMFLIVYRPKHSEWENEYEIVSKVIVDSQGGIIALVFCYCNGEVLSLLKTRLRKIRLLKPVGKQGLTNYTVVSQRIMDTDKHNGNRDNGCQQGVERIMLTEPDQWNTNNKHDM
ncbi:hypothetical protein ACF0H5_018046 [Mactra antiquata]